MVNGKGAARLLFLFTIYEMKLLID